MTGWILLDWSLFASDGCWTLSPDLHIDQKADPEEPKQNGCSIGYVVDIGFLTWWLVRDLYLLGGFFEDHPLLLTSFLGFPSLRFVLTLGGSCLFGRPMLIFDFATLLFQIGTNFGNCGCNFVIRIKESKSSGFFPQPLEPRGRQWIQFQVWCDTFHPQQSVQPW